jgi:hypothetical protein
LIEFLFSAYSLSFGDTDDLFATIIPSQQQESAQPKGQHPVPEYSSGARCGELLDVKRRAEKDTRLVGCTYYIVA